MRSNEEDNTNQPLFRIAKYVDTIRKKRLEYNNDTKKQPRFDAPIPGMSLTHELGARPWQQPAQFTTVEEVVDHYTTRMMNNDEFSEQLVDVMDMGIPLTTIANTIQLAGVMEGKHSVDTGLLALPVLIETMMLIGDTAGVKYNTGMDDVPSKERNSS